MEIRNNQSGVYVILNKINNKIYIGSGVNIHARRRCARVHKGEIGK